MSKPAPLDPLAAAAWLSESYDLLFKLKRQLIVDRAEVQMRRAARMRWEGRPGTRVPKRVA
jgi:hypothetical protein